MISIIESPETGTTIVDPGERFTIENATELLRIVRTVPSAFTPSVIIDLNRTTMVDSSGIGALVSAVKHVQKVGGNFALAGLRPDVQRTFQLMNLYQVFNIFDTLELAEKYMTERRA